MSAPRIKRVKTVAKDTLAGIRLGLNSLKTKREQVATLTDEIPKVQKELIEQILEADPTGKKGVTFEYQGDLFAGYVQQNSASDFYDMEKLIPWLRSDKSRWMSVSSRVLDEKKLAAEIANGNISDAQIKKFTVPGEKPRPFIRFGKPKRESL